MVESPVILAPESPLHDALALAKRVSTTDCNVLDTGESGTGKEVIVRALHRWSNRRNGPFVPVNCGAIPEQLLESELFGHVKGAFTGADRIRIGRFELADGGSIFLDEIGDLPQMLQVKLLRIIQERQVEPLGAQRAKPVDFRLVAATNSSLEEAVKNGSFREDLYFRLNVIRLHLPPLRDRACDVAPLIDYFVRVYNQRFLTEIRGFSRGAYQLMASQPWPGNVRELENFVQGLMVIIGRGEITEKHVMSRLRDQEAIGLVGRYSGSGETGTTALHFSDDGIDMMARLADYESKLIQEALRRSDGNKSKAARLLGLNRTTLVEKLKRKKV